MTSMVSLTFVAYRIYYLGITRRVDFEQVQAFGDISIKMIVLTVRTYSTQLKDQES